ncbi:mdm20p [Saccharomyces arboricola H-6]|uniref:Mdm20p n=1 Tax=Saccharomyces arboricola (strain H-6 / AS 2.3317 / CBS 10644) TaxID=1160507 RepID=J8PWW4_SACAR|nr:mdm20p [Saccharomyces arboricola H-6]
MSDKIQEEILGLISKSSFKQCYARLGQLQKQFPNAAYFKILEAYVKFKQSPSKFEYRKLLDEPYGLKGTNITGDTRSLEFLHNFFMELGKYNEALHVYERGNFKFPSYELSYHWFTKALEDANYNEMGKASLQLAKHCDSGFLPKRAYYFWNAISTLAIMRFQKDTVSEPKKVLLAKLARQSLLNLKPFENVQEIIVYCSVLDELFPASREISEEIVAITFINFDTSVNLYLKNYILKHAKLLNSPEKLFEVCSKLIGKGLDDYELIINLIDAAHKLSKPQEELQNWINENLGDSRNTRLARLKLDLVYSKSVSESSLSYYLSKYHNKPCCSIDVSRYMDHISTDMLKNVMAKYDPTDNDLIHHCNALELKLLESNSINSYNKFKETLTKKSITDYSSCSAFILEIIKSVCKETNPDLKDILLCITILENYQTKDPHNFDTMCWLIVLYMYLGLVPDAYFHFSNLKIKNVQTDSMDYLIFTRFSTLFPNKQSDFYSKTFHEHNNLYDVSLANLPKYIQIAFEKNSYSKIPGMFEMRDRLMKSHTRWMKTLENLQFSRLCNDKRSNILQKMHTDWRSLEMTGDISFSDNRDFSILDEHFGQFFCRDKVLEYANLSKESIMLGLIRELIIEVLPSGEKTKQISILFEKLPLANLEDLLNNNLTKVESVSFLIFFEIYENNGKELHSLISKLMDIPLNAKQNWNISHIYLTKITTLKTLDSLKRIKDKEVQKLIKNSLKELRGCCDNLFKGYSNTLIQAFEDLQRGESNELLKELDFKPESVKNTKNSLLSIQKNVRNL